jgi:hypothetical protein
MLKGNKKYIFFLVLCFALLIALQVIAPKPINWSLSYVKKDKMPYGTAALYEMLPSVFQSQTIKESKTPIYNTLNWDNYEKTNYIFINESFTPDELDTRELLKFVEKGNSVFIAANYFSGKFADTLKLKTDDYIEFNSDLSEDSTVIKNLYKQYDTAKLNFVSPYLKNKTSYIYSKGVTDSYFTSFDTSKATILGINGINKSNFVKIKIGKGDLLISTVPEVYTNYNFVNASNSFYVFKSLSYLPNQSIIWDEYYKVGNVIQENPLRVIFNNPALSAAYYLSIVSIIVFMLIGIKRKQRIIPIVEPLQNTTMKFVETVGTLYYQTGNHKNIASKKINYFLEHVRKTFHLKTTIYDDVFIGRLSNLSGIEEQKIHDLFYYFSDIESKNSISQQELLKLNRLIEEFYQSSNRK